MKTLTGIGALLLPLTVGSRRAAVASARGAVILVHVLPDQHADRASEIGTAHAEEGGAMPRISLVDPESAPPDTKAAYDEIRTMWGGQVFTDWQPLGGSPQILVALSRLFYNLQGEHGGSLADVRDKELVAIKTSHVNDCQYCLGHNVDLGQAAGLSLAEIQAAISPDYDD